MADPIATRRFILLCGETYYARGGFHDFITSYDFLDDAMSTGRSLELSKDHNEAIEWWHIWDCEIKSVVACSESQAHGASDKAPTLQTGK